jgi:PAS domain S-box-containing protein
MNPVSSSDAASWTCDEASRAAAEGSFLERLRTVNEQHEFRFRRKDGTCIWALVSGSPIRSEGGATAGALAMITDIEAFKRTEEALRRSEAEFRVVFEHSAVGMALLTDHGRITRSNPSLREFLGYSAEELETLTLDDVTHPEDREGTRELYRKLTNHGDGSHRSERRCLRRMARSSSRMTASLVALPACSAFRDRLGGERNGTPPARRAVRASERLRAMMYSAVTDVLFLFKSRRIRSTASCP